jgi:hypothetical protein
MEMHLGPREGTKSSGLAIVALLPSGREGGSFLAWLRGMSQKLQSLETHTSRGLTLTGSGDRHS